MLRQRNKPLELPLTNAAVSSTNTFTTPRRNSASTFIDGSGKSIKMEAPIVKAARNASAYTRYSYIWLVGSIFSIFFGWFFVTHRYASTYLTCNEDGKCTLKITPPKRQKKLSLTFTKEQLITAKSIRVNIEGDPVDPNEENNTDLKEEKNDTEESYESYYIVLNQYGKDAAEAIQEELHIKELEEQLKLSMESEEADMLKKYGSAARTDPALGKYEEEKRTKEEKWTEMKTRLEQQRKYSEEIVKENDLLPSLESILPFATKEADHQYHVIMRRYNVGQKRRRVASLISKINMYIAGQKDTLIIRENRIVAWQGILLIVFGVFSMLLSMLLGQFSEPEKYHPRRRKHPQTSSTSSSSVGMGTTVRMGSQKPISTASYSSSSHKSGGMSQNQYPPKAYGGYNPNKSSYSY